MSTTSIDVSAAMSKEILDTPLLSDDIFIIASEKFANLAHQEDTTDTEPIKYLKSSTSLTSQTSFESREMRIAFDLAFSCLRYRTHLEELLIESGFLGGAPLGDDLNTLVIVMLWDFVKRKFVCRGTRSKLQLGNRIEEVEEVETQLGNYAIKLAASLARMRIRESALTLGDTLSEELRAQEHIRAQLPVYGWVNPRKARAKEISDELEAAGIEFEPGIGLQDGLFVFSHEFLTPIELSDAVKQKKMLIVDSTSLVGPQAVANLLNGEESEDVLLCGGCTSSLPMLAEVVVKAGKILDEELTQSRFLFASGDEPNTSQANKPKLIVCLPTKKHQEVRDMMTEYGVNEDVYELVPPLSTMQPTDVRLLHVKVVLIEPRCSLSAAADPLRFMLMEGLDDNDPRLHALAKGVSQPQEGLKLILAASLLLPRSAATLYLTRSSISKENEEVIQYGISQLPAKSEFKLSPVPLKMPIDVIEKGSAGKYLRLPASESGSGCFLATISRNILDPKHAARKSALKGLLAPPRRPKKESGLRGSESRQSITSSVRSSRKF